MKPWIYLSLLLCACGGTSPQPSTVENSNLTADDNHGETAAKDSSSNAVDVPPEAPSITTVTRDELNALIESGPGQVLAMVQTDSVIENGRFIGFKIVGFRIDAPSILRVQPGDIVSGINGLPLERPEHLLKIFERLRTATAIEFTVLRNGEPMTLITPVQ